MFVNEGVSGWRLRAARAERGLTEEDLAREMRRWAELQDAPRPEITANLVAEWEGGAVPIDGDAIRLLWLALETPSHGCADVDVWSLFRPRRQPPRTPHALERDRLDAVLDGSSHVDRRLVETLAFLSRQFTKRWGTEPVPVFRRELHAHMEVLLTLLDHAMTGDLRRDLQSAGATTAACAGFVSILVGLPDQAAVYLELGRRLATEAGDAEGEAMSLLFSSQLHSRVCPAQPDGDPAQARALLEAADQRLGRTTAPVANAWVLLREAEELAGRDGLSAFRLIDEADRLTAAAGRIPADGLCSRWSTDLHVAYRGRISVLAGQPARGIPLLEAALAALPKVLVATRPMAMADLGGAYAQQGEIDQACALLGVALGQALAAGVPDPVARVVQVREQRLAAHAGHAAVRELDEQLRGQALSTR